MTERMGWRRLQTPPSPKCLPRECCHPAGQVRTGTIQPGLKRLQGWAPTASLGSCARASPPSEWRIPSHCSSDRLFFRSKLFPLVLSLPDHGKIHSSSFYKSRSSSGNVQWGLPRTFFSPSWTSPALSVCFQRRSAPVLCLSCCPAGHPSVDSAQNTVGLPGCMNLLLAHVQLFVHQDSQVLQSCTQWVLSLYLCLGLPWLKYNTLLLAVLNLIRFT